MSIYSHVQTSRESTGTDKHAAAVSSRGFIDCLQCGERVEVDAVVTNGKKKNRERTCGSFRANQEKAKSERSEGRVCV